MRLPTTAVWAVCLAASLGQSGAYTPAFPLHTQDRWIVDRHGHRVKLGCANWAGAAQKDGVVGGLGHNSVYNIAKLLKDMGFNCVRLPYSTWMVLKDPAIPADRQQKLLSHDPEFKGKTALEIYDAVINACAAHHLMVVVDNHMSDGDWCCSDFDENGLWYNARWTEADWLEAHKKMAKRYRGQPWVIGQELRNEVRDSEVGKGAWVIPKWGGGGANDWHRAATEAGNAVLQINPNLLIVVGGISYQKDLSGIGRKPVKLNVPHKVVYAAHCYAWSYPGVLSYPALKAQLGRDWGYIVTPGKSWTAPVWVNEFGTFHDCRKHTCEKWWPDFLRYLSEGDYDWSVWRIDGTNSRNSKQKEGGIEKYGVLDETWTKPAFHSEMLRAIQTIMKPNYGPGIADRQCKSGCNDIWKPNWSGNRKGADACSVCMRNYNCRSKMTPEEWCHGTWARTQCAQTCCMAHFITENTCSAGHAESLGASPEAELGASFNASAAEDAFAAAVEEEAKARDASDNTSWLKVAPGEPLDITDNNEVFA